MMKAGSELDNFIAEKVMRWHITTGEYSGKEYWNDENDYSPYSVNDFRPSTNISVAWQVVEKIKIEHGYAVEILETKVRSYCTIKDFTYDISSADAETAPLAICLAALKAVE